MRLLMRLALPATPPDGQKNESATPDFRAQWQALIERIGALRDDARGDLHYVMLDIEPDRITPIAEAVFRLTGVKPEFLPEIVPPPYYGARNY
jgi:hypothetical protein